MAQGTVRWFDAEYGVGTISGDDGTELAVRQSEIDGGGHQSLRARERVAFIVDQGPTGPHATGVYTQ